MEDSTRICYKLRLNTLGEENIALAGLAQSVRAAACGLKRIQMLPKF